MIVNNHCRNVEQKTCPKCGNSIVKPKGYASSKTVGTVRVLKCVNCGRRFKEKYARELRNVNIPSDLLEKYLEAGSLRRLTSELKIDRSEKTVHRWLIKKLKGSETWEDFTPKLIKQGGLSHIAGLDLTNLRIQGKTYYYLHVADFPSNHLVYEILCSKDAESIKPILRKLRMAGYVPAIVVTDRAEELISSTREVYPTTIIQGCLFHLRMWLEKRLPTYKLRDQAKANQWNSIKRLIMRAALSNEIEEKEKYVLEIRSKLSSSIELRARKVIEDFLRDAYYYHPLRQLMLYGCRPSWRYNNTCERAMASVKNLGRRMYGFKKLELAKKYINTMWTINMKRKLETTYGKESQGSGPLKLTLPLTLFTYDTYVDLEEVAKAHNIKIEKLKLEVEKMGYYVVGDVAFAKDYIEMTCQKLSKERPRTLKDIMNITNLDYNSARKLAEAMGLKLVYLGITPEVIFIR